MAVEQEKISENFGVWCKSEFTKIPNCLFDDVLNVLGRLDAEGNCEHINLGLPHPQ